MHDALTRLLTSESERIALLDDAQRRDECAERDLARRKLRAIEHLAREGDGRAIRLRGTLRAEAAVRRHVLAEVRATGRDVSLWTDDGRVRAMYDRERLIAGGRRTAPARPRVADLPLLLPRATRRCARVRAPRRRARRTAIRFARAGPSADDGSADSDIALAVAGGEP